MTNNALKWEVFIQKRSGLNRNLPEGNPELMWVANSVTLLEGPQQLMLVDTFLTEEQSNRLIAWLRQHDKPLTHIYITHPHGDHFFGLSALIEAFPAVKALSTPEIVEGMKQHVEFEKKNKFFQQLFPGQISDNLAVASACDREGFTFAGHDIQIIDTGFTDTQLSSSLFVPDVGLLVAGDVVYNGIHPYLGETTAETRQQWIDTLNSLEKLSPAAVVAGHKIPENDDSPRCIDETRRYLDVFNQLAIQSTSALQLYQQMLQRYPTRVNPGSLWTSANAVFNGR